MLVARLDSTLSFSTSSGNKFQKEFKKEFSKPLIVRLREEDKGILILLSKVSTRSFVIKYVRELVFILYLILPLCEWGRRRESNSHIQRHKLTRGHYATTAYEK